ncbi:chromate reductase [Antricoccus suffuscus]|uniref:Chromate reductase n=2 Tax=Antricoccus suffuscus TaxID=1629062 RepID=A0A2T0ZYZ6_9ACTN|nr:chromate reductase [Antricoccus suffuscus]
MVLCGLIGSIRRDSFNRKLMQAAVDRAPTGVDIRVADVVGKLPLFNEDLLVDEPSIVLELKRRVAEADALLIATPEYNGGVPGPLKNALDWLSIPLGQSVLQHKPVAIIGASAGRLGTARSQFELRHTFVFSRSPVVPGPELLLSMAAGAFDEEYRLTDPVAIERLDQIFEGLGSLVRMQQQEGAIL